MHRARLGGRPLWPLGLLLLAIAAALAVLIATKGPDYSEHGRQLALMGRQLRDAREHQGGTEAGSRHGGEGGEAGKEGERDREKREGAATVEGHKGGEGDRHGGHTPWAEQVANRAYPRSYVDDRRARAEQQAFHRVPQKAPRSSFRSQQAQERAIATAPDHWTNLGPRTPNVTGEASQFYDPSTRTGPPTQESGRVTALAVDPACAPGDCRLWVASAGGGIWRTDDALAEKPQWIAPPDDLPTNAFGSLIYDAAHDTLYAGSGEGNGSSDSEAGLGLFKSTDGGVTWSLVPGSAPAATNRAVSAIAVDPTNPDVLYIGTSEARHGASSTTSSRRTPPGAPDLGVYKSTDGGQTFTLEQDLSTKAPQSPADRAAGADATQGGINVLELDPNDTNSVYAAVRGYGVWRSTDAGSTWAQVFHTMNQTDFGTGDGDSIGDRTEFDLVDNAGTTRAYLGDASDDFVLDGDDATPLPEVYRSDDVAAIVGDPTGQDPANLGWATLSNSTNGTNGFAAYGWCQNGQCWYDAFVKVPPGHPDQVWLGGSMNYDELPAYAGQPPRSNGRAVIRSLNADEDQATTTWQDMTTALTSDDAWDPSAGIHPDLHAIAFANDGDTVFIGQDGGIVREDAGADTTVDRSGSCDNRRYVYDDAVGPEPLRAPDLADCHEMLSAIPDGGSPGDFTAPGIVPINDGLADLQFQSLSYNPKNPEEDIQGGTQDNGTWSFKGTPAWFESVGGDGGQSGYDAVDPNIRYHNYFDSTPEVNFHGDDPTTWLDIYDPLENSAENRAFYTPFIADPTVGGRAYTGLEHVWRTEDHGGAEGALAPSCNAAHLDPGRNPCGDWAPVGPSLTAASLGDRAGQYVVGIERAPSDDDTLWAVTRTGRVFVSGNAGDAASAVKFDRIDTATTPGRFPSGIAIDAKDPDHAFVAYSGYDAYTPATPGHVFDVRYHPATHDATFTDITANIGDQPVTDVVYDSVTGDVFASTDFGVLRRATGSTTWQQAAPGMPQVAIYGLTLSESGRVLYAATHGRSAYALKLAAPPGGGGGGGGGGTATPTPTPTVTATPTPAPPGSTPPDTAKPKLTLSKVKTVRRPARSVVRGRATDKGGVRSVRIRWGDGTKRTTAKLSTAGRFTVRHRYKTVKRFTVRVTATDKAGNGTTNAIHARVLKKRQAGA
jgi:hypothetical protein